MSRFKDKTVVSITRKWLINSVIAHNFCPYAKQPFEDNRIGYEIYTGDEPIELLERLANILLELDKTPESSLETVLLVASHPEFLVEFYEYLDLLDMANAFIEKPSSFIMRFSNVFQKHESKKLPKSWFDEYQLASFHPKYVFADAGEDDRENYTNRSPFPIFHILRNSSIDTVRVNDAKAERIVERNCAHLKNMSVEAFSELVELKNTNLLLNKTGY